KTAKIDHYSWDQLEREHVRPGVSRAGFRGQDVLLVMNWLKPGMETRPHSHDCEQVVYVVAGRMRFHIGDETVEVETGGLVRIPPGAVHYGEPIGDEEVLNLDVFAPIREDYRHLVEYQAAHFQAGAPPDSRGSTI
ncbi:MAG TPA: cupin domain-containing protein, partial [Sphingomonas sp.]|nr:cupin domain-containing protein [Sphingomonas sp.]